MIRFFRSGGSNSESEVKVLVKSEMFKIFSVKIRNYKFIRYTNTFLLNN
jgi:hypothetical protein